MSLCRYLIAVAALTVLAVSAGQLPESTNVSAWPVNVRRFVLFVHAYGDRQISREQLGYLTNIIADSKAIPPKSIKHGLKRMELLAGVLIRCGADGQSFEKLVALLKKGGAAPDEIAVLREAYAMLQRAYQRSTALRKRILAAGGVLKVEDDFQPFVLAGKGCTAKILSSFSRQNPALIDQCVSGLVLKAKARDYAESLDEQVLAALAKKPDHRLFGVYAGLLATADIEVFKRKVWKQIPGVKEDPKTGRVYVSGIERGSPLDRLVFATFRTERLVTFHAAYSKAKADQTALLKIFEQKFPFTDGHVPQIKAWLLTWNHQDLAEPLVKHHLESAELYPQTYQILNLYFDTAKRIGRPVPSTVRERVRKQAFSKSSLSQVVNALSIYGHLATEADVKPLVACIEAEKVVKYKYNGLEREEPLEAYVAADSLMMIPGDRSLAELKRLIGSVKSKQIAARLRMDLYRRSQMGK